MSMKHSLSAALSVLMLLLVSGQVSAQRDTTVSATVFSGRLVEATTAAISVEAYSPDGSVSLMTFDLNAASVVVGCALDEVNAGTFATVIASPDAAGRQLASFVKFDGCSPTWYLTGRIVAIEKAVLQVELTVPSDLGDAGQNVDLAITDTTSVLSCDGSALAPADVTVGATVSITATGASASDLTAVSVVLQDDCPQVLHVQASFVSFDGKTMVVTDQATSETLRLGLSSEYGRIPGDTTVPLYSCEGLPLDPSLLQVGDVLSIVYILVPNRGSFLQFGQSTVDCPIHVAGRVTTRDGNMMTISLPDATYTALITNETSIVGCDRNSMTPDEITIGSFVQALILQGDNGSTFRSIQVQDGCPFAFYAAGIVASIDGRSITIDGMTSEDGVTSSVTLAIDDATQAINCIGSAQTIASITPGSSVVTYYRINGSQRVADMVLVQSPCDVAAIHGTILEVGDGFVVVSEDGVASLSLLYSPNSLVTNCNGEKVSFTSDMVGAAITATYSTTSKPPMLVSASVSIGCPVIVTQGGVITAIGDSSVTIQSAGTIIELNRTPFTSAYDAMLQPIEWSTLRVGDNICSWYNDAGKELYRIAVGIECSTPNMGSTAAVVGSILRADDREIVVDGRAGTMSFALTAATEMSSTADRPVSTSDLQPGTMVSVMTSTFTSKGQPVASSVTLMSVTSVDEEPATASSVRLFPNPASHTVTVANVHEGDVISIFDQQGNLVVRTSSATITLDELAPGLYTVAHRSASGVTAAPLVILR